MAERNKQKVLISYEPEADILRWEMSDEPIDHAEEVGNLIAHFSKKIRPFILKYLRREHLSRKQRISLVGHGFKKNRSFYRCNCCQNRIKKSPGIRQRIFW